MPRHPPGTVLFAAGLAVLCFGCGPDDGDDGAPELTGYYEGSVQSQTLGELAVAANLRDEGEGLSGTLVTPLGDLPLREEGRGPEGLKFQFTAPDGEVGTVAVRWDGEELSGRFTLTVDSGSVFLTRVGPWRDELEFRPETLALSASEWREDLKYLTSRLAELHGNAFHTVSQERFEAAAEEVAEGLPSLTGYEVVAAMQRLVALVGDGHTYLRVPEAFRRYPLRLYWFGDELRVTEVAAGYEELLGGRVLRIGGMETDEAEARIRAQLARGENEYYLLSNGAYFLTIAEILQATGVLGDMGRAGWTVETDPGDSVTVALSPVTEGEVSEWVSAAASPPLFRQRPSEELWSTLLPESGTLYVAFRGYPPTPAFRSFVEELFEVAEEPEVERLVLDLRENGGGDFTKVREEVFPHLREHRLNREDRLFVLIGRRTFSAAMTNAADFLRETRATLVGEPTGARPNGWQESRRFTLPNSGLTVSYSVQFYEFLEEDLPWVPPHVRIDPDWESYREGRDPVLEWVETERVGRSPLSLLSRKCGSVRGRRRGCGGRTPP